MPRALRRYEAENEKLLRDFKALEERDAMHGHHRLGSPTGPKSSMDSAELENLRHNLKQKDVELQTAANELVSGCALGPTPTTRPMTHPVPHDLPQKTL